jgi:hypothetical protein
MAWQRARLHSALDRIPDGHVAAAGLHHCDRLLGLVVEAVTGEAYGLGTTSGTVNGWDWFGHSGALLRCRRNVSGEIVEIWLAAINLRPAAKVAREMETRYAPTVKRGTPAG